MTLNLLNTPFIRYLYSSNILINDWLDEMWCTIGGKTFLNHKMLDKFTENKLINFSQLPVIW